MFRARRRLLAVSVLAVLALVLAACGNDDNNDKSTATTSGGGGKTYALAMVGPLTGPNANLGINIEDGAKVAIDEANKSGDIKFVLKPFDTQGDPAQAPTVKDKYINDT